MQKQGKVKVGIIGSQFEADIHAAAFKSCRKKLKSWPSPRPRRTSRGTAKRYGIPRIFYDYRQMLREDDIEMVTSRRPTACMPDDGRHRQRR